MKSVSRGGALSRDRVLWTHVYAHSRMLPRSPTSSFSSRESVVPDRSTQSTTPRRRTLDEVRDYAANEIAHRAIGQAETIDGVRMGVVLTLSKTDDDDFLRRVAFIIHQNMLVRNHVFAVATTGTSTRPDHTENTLVICGAPEDYVQRAVLLASSKFIGRISTATNDGLLWVAIIRAISPTDSSDEAALWDVLRKSARPPMDPLSPPPGSMSAESLLAASRARLERLTPKNAYKELLTPAVSAPTFLIDIRDSDERARAGGIHGSLVLPRNGLEWRFDPRNTGADRLTIADRYDLRVILICEDGRASSLAAVSLQNIGLLNATDVVGGYRAWREARLPVDVPVAPSRGPPSEFDVVDDHTEPSVIQILD